MHHVVVDVVGTDEDHGKTIIPADDNPIEPALITVVAVLDTPLKYAA
jgi:hypothetical protein